MPHHTSRVSSPTLRCLSGASTYTCRLQRQEGAVVVRPKITPTKCSSDSAGWSCEQGGQVDIIRQGPGTSRPYRPPFRIFKRYMYEQHANSVNFVRYTCTFRFSRSLQSEKVRHSLFANLPSDCSNSWHLEALLLQLLTTASPATQTSIRTDSTTQFYAFM